MKKIIIVVITNILAFCATAQVQIKAEDVKNHIGEVVSLCGKVFSGRYLQNANNQPTLLNLGGEYPNQLVTIAIFENDRKNFPFKPEEYYPDMHICVTGKLIEYRGMPEIIVQSVEQIKLQLNDKEKTETASIAKTELKIPIEPIIEKKSSEPVKEKKIAFPVIEKKNTPSTKTENQYDITITHDINLRSAPSTESEPITVLPAGSIVTFLSSQNGWSYVSVKKQLGTTALPDNGYIKNSVLK